MVGRPHRAHAGPARAPLLVLTPLLFAAAIPGQLRAQAQARSPAHPLPDLTREPTLFVVGYAHLDTQWRWDFVTTIREYLPKTLRENFALLEKYPNYIFNFSGANRYRMIREYYPADYERLKEYVALGRWFPAGSSVEENDVNAPSVESILRQLLYGTLFFRREFGRTSAEYMLPDCFGFPASLPSILAHAGIGGFSTQKLSPAWQPAARVGGAGSPQETPEGIPFNLGIWEGPDGATVLAALNPGSYAGSVTYDLSKTPPPPPEDTALARRRPLVDWPARIRRNGESSGIFADYMYYGTGDTGGSPTEASVRLLEAIVTRGLTVLPDPWGRRGGGDVPAAAQPVRVGDGPVRVVSATAEELFLAIRPEQTARLPRYKGELELINHSAGSLTSQAYVKRWNHQNEVLAGTAERASVAAEWMRGLPYPQKRLNDAWTLVPTGQFHDIIPGTSIPKAYEYSWNDEVLAHEWFDLTDRSGRFGATVLSEAKLGSDKPDDGTLRLTLVRTPGTRGGYEDQSTQDLGRHTFAYGLAGHGGDWREGKTYWQAYRLDQPLAAFRVPKHPGVLGRSFSFLRLSHQSVRVLALKKAEESDEYVIRLVEQEGRPARGVRIGFAGAVTWAREVNGVEAPLGPAEVTNGELVVDFGPYQPRTFAFRLAPAPHPPSLPRVQTLALPFDQAVASPDGRVGFGRFDRAGRSLPAELFPRELTFGPIPFLLGPALGLNAVTARGQTLPLPSGEWNRLYVLAAAEGDQTATFLVGDSPSELTVHDWSGYIGQWDNRRWTSKVDTVPPPPGSPPGTAPRIRSVEEMAGLVPGFVKPAPVAWFASHRHATDGANEPYAYAYLFAYALDLPGGTRTVTLPWNERIRILAATVAWETGRVVAAQPLFDTVERGRGP